MAFMRAPGPSPTPLPKRGLMESSLDEDLGYSSGGPRYSLFCVGARAVDAAWKAAISRRTRIAGSTRIESSCGYLAGWGGCGVRVAAPRRAPSSRSAARAALPRSAPSALPRSPGPAQCPPSRRKPDTGAGHVAMSYFGIGGPRRSLDRAIAGRPRPLDLLDIRSQALITSRRGEGPSVLAGHPTNAGPKKRAVAAFALRYDVGHTRRLRSAPASKGPGALAVVDSIGASAPRRSGREGRLRAPLMGGHVGFALIQSTCRVPARCAVTRLPPHGLGGLGQRELGRDDVGELGGHGHPRASRRRTRRSGSARPRPFLSGLRLPA